MATCTDDGWGNGRLVFIDANADGVIDVGELVIKQSLPLVMGLTATPAAGFVTFNARGRSGRAHDRHLPEQLHRPQHRHQVDGPRKRHHASGGLPMMRSRLKHIPGRARSAGFSLVEVMVSILVLSFGMLGVASLLATSLSGSHTSSLRTQAIVLADDLADRMRANRATAVSPGPNNYERHCACGESLSRRALRPSPRGAGHVHARAACRRRLVRLAGAAHCRVAAGYRRRLYRQHA